MHPRARAAVDRARLTEQSRPLVVEPKRVEWSGEIQEVSAPGDPDRFACRCL